MHTQMRARHKRRWQQTGSNISRPRPGRKPKLSERQKRLAFRIARKTPKIQYEKLIREAHLQRICSRKTVYRGLKDIGLINFRAKRRPKITRENARIRYQWCEWRRVDWRRVTVRFSDECSVQKGSGNDREWVFRFPWETWNHKMITEVLTSRAPAQMVWACIWIDRNGRTKRSPLVIMERDPNAPNHGYSANSYQDALREGLLPSYRPGEIYMQDNARVHTAYSTQEFIESYGIWVMDWPPYSPDLNPIEHLWWAFKRNIQKHYPELSTHGRSQEEWDRFCDALKDCWEKIPTSLIRKLILSMPRRITAVRAAKGYQTRY